MYFDVENGLLVRRLNGNPTIFGPNYQQIDFSDYRDVGTGTKVPFLHINQHYDERSRETVTLVQDNVPMTTAFSSSQEQCGDSSGEQKSGLRRPGESAAWLSRRATTRRRIDPRGLTISRSRPPAPPPPVPRRRPGVGLRP